MQFIFRGRYAITPGLSKALEAIDALTGRKNMNPDQKQFLRDPRRVLSDSIQATPTLIKLSPAPVRKIIGDLGEEAKVLFALGL